MTKSPYKKSEGFLHNAIVKVSELSYTTIVSIYLLSVLFFGAIYFALSWYFPGNGPVPDVAGDPLYGFLNSLFFSTITATSVGFGDYSPTGFSKVVACIQSFVSLLLAAIFVTKPISTKQEQALFTMHSLTFDSSFSSLREGLYVVRHDFETFVSEAERKGSLSPRTWRNIATAFRHMQVLVEDAGKVIRSEGGLYSIDKHREILLLEAVERTLERLDGLIDSLDARQIDWRGQKQVMNRFLKLLSVIKKTADRWKKQSPNRAPEDFKDVEKLIGELEKEAKEKIVLTPKA